MAPAHKKQRLSHDGAGELLNIDQATNHEETPQGKDDANERDRRSLFVRSLPANTTSEALTELFSDSYPIKHATAVTDAETGQCRGYGFVTFADAEDAQRAKEKFNGHILEGRKLRIEVAEPRQRNAEKDSASQIAKSRRGQAEQETQQPPKLIVRNLPWTIKTPEQLTKLFLSYGKVKQAYLPKKRNGLLAGFGFVLLRGRKNAEKAIDGVNGKEVDGRTLAVDWALTKEVYEGLVKDGDQSTQNAQDQHQTKEVDGDASVQMHNDEEINSAPNSDLDSEDATVDDIEDPDDDGDTQLDDSPLQSTRYEDKLTTLFIRNLPFTCTDEDLEDHFSQFGNTRYARVVMDTQTERSKGTGFVCFYNTADADSCLKSAPRRMIPSENGNVKEAKPAQPSNSILQNAEADPSGRFTLDGRVLQVSRAVDKSEANRLTEEGATRRRKQNEDKRRIYLLSEGTISSNSKIWESLSPSERAMRDASAKQRKALIENNPSLHLSLTRLSVRNIPRSVASKELKALAREALVGFASDVKAGNRQKLSKEELARGGEEMRAAEQVRKKSGKGVVKQAKVVFEGEGGSKVSEDSGAGRSRGYGFIEYHTHRSALMGLRWLNGHAVDTAVRNTKEETQDRKKRLIVEFAIENAQVVNRRKDKEAKARERSLAVQSGLVTTQRMGTAAATEPIGSGSRKRKRGSERPPKHDAVKPRITDSGQNKVQLTKTSDEKTKKRNQIIGRKRAMRQARKVGSRAAAS